MGWRGIASGRETSLITAPLLVVVLQLRQKAGKLYRPVAFVILRATDPVQALIAKILTHIRAVSQSDVDGTARPAAPTQYGQRVKTALGQSVRAYAILAKTRHKHDVVGISRISTGKSREVIE